LIYFVRSILPVKIKVRQILLLLTKRELYGTIPYNK
jgi:hypothetical protein